METLTFEDCVCFTCGLAVVYIMFRAMGVLVVLFLLALSLTGNAQTNLDLVVNADPIPVVVTAQSTPDYWPAAAAGFGFGLTVCGFGWVLRIAKRVGKTTYD